MVWWILAIVQLMHYNIEQLLGQVGIVAEMGVGWEQLVILHCQTDTQSNQQF